MFPDPKPELTNMQKIAMQAGQSMQKSFADFLFDPFKKGLGGMVTGFIDAIRHMLANQMALQLFQMIGGWGDANRGAGGFMGGVAGLAGGLFGSGFTNTASGAATGTLTSLFGFASGGRPPTGQPSLVGENGPELFIPDTSGTIVPNGAMGGNLHFAPVYNINAPNGDAQLRAALPTLLAQTAAKSKRDLLDAFNRSGFGAPRTA
jgi:phage-related minor tail protein